MLLVMRGYTSSYALWSYAQEKKTEYIKPVAYKNVNQRFLRLARLGFLEETQLGNNPHRRIDYKLTMKGLEELIPYILGHPDQLKSIVEYMDKFNLDTEAFSALLFNKYDLMKKLVSKYENSTTADLSRELESQRLSGREAMTYYGTSFGIFSRDKENALVKDLLNLMKEGLMDYDPYTLMLVRTKKGRKFVSVPMIKLSASLLAKMHLSPSTMSLQKKWEDEEEEFQYEEKLQSERINSSMSKNESKKQVEELIGQGYISYNPKTKLYRITQEGEKYMKSNGFKSIEEFVTNRPHIYKKPT